MPDEDGKEAGPPSESGAEAAVVNPRPSRLEPRIYDPVIFCPVGPLVLLAARIYKARKQLRPLEPARVYTVRDQEKRLSLVGPALGAPAAVFVLERLIAHGARNVVMLGLCGSINPEARIGDVVVPTWALSEEGTSRHYAPKARKIAPTPRGLGAVRKALEFSGKGYRLGPVWTTDAVFRETAAKVKGYGQRGVLAVEMEASALFTVAGYRGIDLAALLVVSDELHELRWKPGFTRPRFLSACRHAIHIARLAARLMADAGKTAVPGPEDAQSESEPAPPSAPEDGPKDGT